MAVIVWEEKFYRILKRGGDTFVFFVLFRTRFFFFIVMAYEEFSVGEGRVKSNRLSSVIMVFNCLIYRVRFVLGFSRSFRTVFWIV